jgi:hypothetical protein
VEKVFDLKLVSIFILITDRDRNFNLSYKTFKFNLFFLIFMVTAVRLKQGVPTASDGPVMS